MTITDIRISDSYCLNRKIIDLDFHLKGRQITTFLQKTLCCICQRQKIFVHPCPKPQSAELQHIWQLLSLNVTCMSSSERKAQKLRAKQEIVPVFPLRILCKDNFSSQTTHNLIKPNNIKFTNHKSKNWNLRSSKLFLQHLDVQGFPQVKNHLSRTKSFPI